MPLKLKDLKNKRQEKRKSRFDAQYAVDAKKEELPSSTEARLKHYIERAESPTIRLRLV